LKKRYLVILVILLLFTVNGFIFAGTYSYQVTGEEEQWELIYDIEETEHNKVIEGTDRGRKTYLELSLENLNTEKHILDIPEEDTFLEMIKENGEIIISGKMNGEEVEKKHDIGDELWLQNFSFSLQKFVLSDEDRIDFVGVSTDDLSTHEMFATREGVETVSIGEEEYEAYKVRVRLRGFLRFFWDNHYWFRKADGLFIKQIGEMGEDEEEAVVELIQ